MKGAFELQTMHELEAWREAQDSKTTWIWQVKTRYENYGFDQSSVSRA